MNERPARVRMFCRIQVPNVRGRPRLVDGDAPGRPFQAQGALADVDDRGR
jgi:hypothetical protein